MEREREREGEGEREGEREEGGREREREGERRREEREGERDTQEIDHIIYHEDKTTHMWLCGSVTMVMVERGIGASFLPLPTCLPLTGCVQRVQLLANCIVAKF